MPARCFLAGIRFQALDATRETELNFFFCFLVWSFHPIKLHCNFARHETPDTNTLNTIATSIMLVYFQSPYLVPTCSWKVLFVQFTICSCNSYLSIYARRNYVYYVSWRRHVSDNPICSGASDEHSFVSLGYSYSPASSWRYCVSDQIQIQPCKCLARDTTCHQFRMMLPYFKFVVPLTLGYYIPIEHHDDAGYLIGINFQTNTWKWISVRFCAPWLHPLDRHKM